MNHDFKKNIRNSEQWYKVAWIILFMVAYSVVKVVLFAIVVVQIIYTLIFSEQQQRLRCFAAQLALYIYQLVQFVTYNQEEKPFPFSAWPEVDCQPSPCDESETEEHDQSREDVKEEVKTEAVVVEAEIVNTDPHKKGESNV
ncbi:MAG: DUF4389 domain-containing protein [Mariprofundaceae bacterium]|nr:DUF4389 domain-containing protein [Mariprofundaceae bacterium]